MEKNQSKVKPLDWTKNAKGFSYPIFFVIIIVVLLLGVGGGYLLSAYGPKINSTTTTKTDKEDTTKGEGIADKKEFPDQAEGKMKAGGIDGEGNFHLVRPGGDSQNVYLTSSTVDLSKYIGKKVRVWGKTFESEKAGWLMDVGFVENL
jgi:hypothetical protein